MRYVQRVDGEAFIVPERRAFRLACCDCGLVHDVVLIRGKRGEIAMAAKRNPRATAARRRKNRKGK